MAIDGITIKAITIELYENLVGGRIQKIYQINSHTILINIYNKKNYTLLISSNPQNPRIHLTEQNYDNPTKPTGYCMILRKHIQNSIIKDIHQIAMDRSIEIIVDCKDDLGFDVEKRLMVDIMGKYSNIVLTDHNYKVIDAIKRISHEMSSVRAVYPGTYFTKLTDEKINILKIKSNLFDITIPNDYKISKIFYTQFTGFGPQIGNEIAFRADIDFNLKWGQLTDLQRTALNDSFISICEIIRNNNFTNYIYKDKSKSKDFYPIELTHLGKNTVIYNSISEAMDIYYAENVNDNSFNQSKDNLKKLLNNILLKSSSKLDNLYLDLENSKIYDEYRIEGDLLSTVAYTINKGQEEIDVNNYYDGNIVKIKLNPKKNSWENIEEKYKISKKLHRTFKMVQNSIPEQIEFIKYINSIIRQLENVDSHNEINEIKDELIEQNLIKKTINKKNKMDKPSKPFKYITNSNNIIYVGKNNKQNEELTLREANSQDYFFHIKDLPGSHVILKSTYKISDEDITIAAFLAAKYSKNENDRYIDVDYTQKKNVFKAKGSKPGMVYYNDFKTIRVDLESNIDGYKLIE